MTLLSSSSPLFFRCLRRLTWTWAISMLSVQEPEMHKPFIGQESHFFSHFC